MINHVIFTGDTHGRPSDRVIQIAFQYPHYEPEETAVIILGDVGLNYYLNKTDWKEKKRLNDTGYRVYCVRGNHEERPQKIPNMVLVFDENVNGMVWTEVEFPNIAYFSDYGDYTILGRRIAVIGGAYSVDKEWRLLTGKTWFPGEQLSKFERDNATACLEGGVYDFVLTHTCPQTWQPKDLFLDFIDQSTVDSSMEIWMDELKEKFKWKHWLFGHYHRDRFEFPYVEMFFEEFDDMEDIEARWVEYKENPKAITLYRHRSKEFSPYFHSEIFGGF